MKFLGLGEFRGKETKTSSKGNNYNSLIFEDTENGQQLRCYSPVSSNYSVPVDSLEKGKVYKLHFNYHFDYGRWQLDLLDILDNGGK